MYCIPFNYIQLDPLCLINRYLFNIWWYNACIRVPYYTFTTGYFLLCWNVKIQFDVTLQNTQQYHRFVTKLVRTIRLFESIVTRLSIWNNQRYLSSTRFYSSTSLLNVADDKYHGYPRVKISHYEMLSTFFSIRYIYTMKRKLWSTRSSPFSTSTEISYPRTKYFLFEETR